MKNKNPNYFQRKNKDDQCIHNENYWCSNCLKIPEKIDFRKEGLGYGFIITNNKN